MCDKSPTPPIKEPYITPKRDLLFKRDLLTLLPRSEDAGMPGYVASQAMLPGYVASYLAARPGACLGTEVEEVISIK